MLEKALLEQIKEVFSSLEGEIELVVKKTDHEKRDELLEMLEQVASTSEKLSVTKIDEKSDIPRFSLRYKGEDTTVHFAGISGGHEFTSLILAILNVDGKGKLPDKGIIHRIKNLKGPIRLKTYISLSCENCPEVVQALNLMSILHDDFSHEMIDGQFAQDEIEKLKIQGVPSTIHHDSLLTAGKSNLADLLTKLEKKFGTKDELQKNQDLGEFDVVVIGAGPAGASAAIYSARKGLKTAIIADKIGGQVQDTKGIENLISVKYTEGPQLAAQLAEHIAQYDIELLEHRRVQKITQNGRHHLELDSGESVRSKAVIVATGAKWRELGIKGEKEYLGRGVAFCPHCDGPYYKGKDVAVVGGGNSGVEAAIDLAKIVRSVTLFEFMPDLKADQVLVDKLRSLENVTIITNARTDEIKGNGDKVISIAYEDRTSGEIKDYLLDGVFVQIGLSPNSQFVKELVELNRTGEIVVDARGRTKVKGLFAAGDVTNIPYKQIIISMGEGAKVALSAFEEITMA